MRIVKVRERETVNLPNQPAALSLFFFFFFKEKGKKFSFCKKQQAEGRGDVLSKLSISQISMGWSHSNAAKLINDYTAGKLLSSHHNLQN